MARPPLGRSSMEFVQAVANGLTYAATLALIATGLTLVFGILRVVNFAHGAMYMVGAYVTYYVTVSLGLNYLLGVVGAGLAIMLLGVVLAAVLFRRYRGLLLEGAVMAIALALLIENTAFITFGTNPHAVISPFSGVVVMAGARIDTQHIFIMGVTLALVIALWIFVMKTRMGRGLRAVQQDSYAATLQGIRVDGVVAITFAIGGFLAGIAGSLVAPTQTLLPNMGETPLLFAFVVIILGGMGSVPGALIASLFLGMVQSFVSTYWTAQASTWISFTLVIVILAIRPRGLFGHA